MFYFGDFSIITRHSLLLHIFNQECIHSNNAILLPLQSYHLCQSLNYIWLAITLLDLFL